MVEKCRAQKSNYCKFLLSESFSFPINIERREIVF
jgi:hypothetical protein